MNEDRAFATGCIEIMFNLGDGQWQTAVNNDFITTSKVELWGQLIQPLRFRPTGPNTMLGIRFFPHTAGLFIDEPIGQFNDQVTDYNAVAGNAIRDLHEQLLNTASWPQRIGLLENYLLKRLAVNLYRSNDLNRVAAIISALKADDLLENINETASRFNLSSRYFQKLFVQHTGIAPKLYSRINRFQKSLQLLGKKEESLTSIAYECNYADQSHFIREFKAFTGLKPSAFQSHSSSALLINVK